jgi:hypothetical protein
MFKTLFLLSCLQLASVAFGQSAAGTAVLDNQPVRINIPSHPQTAAPQPMGTELTLLGDAHFVSAEGTRPLWEVQHPAETMPLGDYARMLRKQQLTAKKAVKVLEK